MKNVNQRIVKGNKQEKFYIKSIYKSQQLGNEDGYTSKRKLEDRSVILKGICR